MTHQVYLSIGSNLGDKSGVCLSAVNELNSSDKITVIARSSLYETEPEGYKRQPSFVNMAVEIQTAFSPEALLVELKEIEKRLGRKKSFRWGPRIIDIDIIFYGSEIVSSAGLEIPHPRTNERAFVLYPLCELDGNIENPVTGKKVADMIKELSCKGAIRKISKDG